MSWEHTDAGVQELFVSITIEYNQFHRVRNW